MERANEGVMTLWYNFVVNSTVALAQTHTSVTSPGFLGRDMLFGAGSGYGLWRLQASSGQAKLK